MSNNNGKGREIFYGVIGVATLVVAIIGATFAYFTASETDANTITGNMASIGFDLAVTKVTTADEELGGMIPMSNGMVEAAIGGSKADTGASPQICVDDNGNAVCQVYKITVQNNGSASMFLDGYVTLTGGSAVPTDYTGWTNFQTTDGAVATTMRWAQAFCEGTDDQLTSCTTAGTTTTGATGTGAGFSEDWATVASTTAGANATQILTTGITANGTHSGNTYPIINTNYIRVSDHATDATSWTRDTDVTSALVYNQLIGSSLGTTTLTTSTDSTETYTDAQVYYIVVWLSETGTNQTAGATSDGTTALPGVPSSGIDFFSGTVAFISAQGSEVTATFGGYAKVEPTDTAGAGN